MLVLPNVWKPGKFQLAEQIDLKKGRSCYDSFSKFAYE